MDPTPLQKAYHNLCRDTKCRVDGHTSAALSERRLLVKLERYTADALVPLAAFPALTEPAATLESAVFRYRRETGGPSSAQPRHMQPAAASSDGGAAPEAAAAAARPANGVLDAKGLLATARLCKRVLLCSQALVSFELTGVALDAAGVALLSSGLEKCACLRELVVKRVPLHEAGLRALVPGLARSNVNALTLAECDLSDQCGALVAKVIKAHQVKRDEAIWSEELRLPPSRVGATSSSANPGVAALGLLLVDVSDNRLSHRSCDALADALRADTWLLGLRLTGNAVGAKACKALSEAVLEDNEAFRTLLVDKNPRECSHNPGLRRQVEALAEECELELSKRAEVPLLAEDAILSAVLAQWFKGEDAGSRFVERDLRPLAKSDAAGPSPGMPGLPRAAPAAAGGGAAAGGAAAPGAGEAGGGAPVAANELVEFVQYLATAAAPPAKAGKRPAPRGKLNLQQLEGGFSKLKRQLAAHALDAKSARLCRNLMGLVQVHGLAVGPWLDDLAVRSGRPKKHDRPWSGVTETEFRAELKALQTPQFPQYRFSDTQTDALLRYVRATAVPARVTPQGESTHLPPSGSFGCELLDQAGAACERAVKVHLSPLPDSVGRVLARLEAYMAGQRWRVTEVYNHVDVKRSGEITVGALYRALAKWKVLDTRLPRAARRAAAAAAAASSAAVVAVPRAAPAAAAASVSGSAGRREHAHAHASEDEFDGEDGAVRSSTHDMLYLGGGAGDTVALHGSGAEAPLPPPPPAQWQRPRSAPRRGKNRAHDQVGMLVDYILTVSEAERTRGLTGHSQNARGIGEDFSLAAPPGDGLVGVGELEHAIRHLRRELATVEQRNEGAELCRELQGFIAAQGLTPEQWFDLMDTSKGAEAGSLGQRELRNGVKKVALDRPFTDRQLTELMRYMDTGGGDSEVDLEELADAFERANRQSQDVVRAAEFGPVITKLERYMMKRRMRIPDLFHLIQGPRGSGRICAKEMRAKFKEWGIFEEPSSSSGSKTASPGEKKKKKHSPRKAKKAKGSGGADLEAGGGPSSSDRATFRDVHHFLAFVDEDGGGEITLPELLDATRKLRRHLLTARLHARGAAVCRALRENVLRSYKSVKEWFKTMDKSKGQAAGSLSTAELAAGVHAMEGFDPSPHDVKELMRYVDRSCDGDLDLAEIKAAFKTAVSLASPKVAVYGKVLNCLDAFLATNCWRTSDLFKHMDMKDSGYVAIPDFRDHLLKWGVFAVTGGREAQLYGEYLASRERIERRGPPTPPAAPRRQAARGPSPGRAAAAAARAPSPAKAPAPAPKAAPLRAKQAPAAAARAPSSSEDTETIRYLENMVEEMARKISDIEQHKQRKASPAGSPARQQAPAADESEELGDEIKRQLASRLQEMFAAR